MGTMLNPQGSRDGAISSCARRTGAVAVFPALHSTGRGRTGAFGTPGGDFLSYGQSNAAD